MIKAELPYNPMEKECLALVFTIQKVDHYLVGQMTHTLLRITYSHDATFFAQLYIGGYSPLIL